MAKKVPSAPTSADERKIREIVFPDRAWNALTKLDPGVHMAWDAEPAGRVSLEWGTTYDPRLEAAR